jgi:hypothetical protein
MEAGNIIFKIVFGLSSGMTGPGLSPSPWSRAAFHMTTIQMFFGAREFLNYGLNVMAYGSMRHNI